MLRVVHGLDDAIEMRQWLHKQPTVAMDTETTGVDVFAPGFKVRLTQFGTKDEAWVIPTEGWEGFVGELIRDYDGRMLMHNARYDILALSRVGVAVPWRKVDDTMIALRLSEPHMSAALKTAATRHVSTVAAAGQLDLTGAMRKQRWDWATVPLDFDPYVFYAAMDTVLTARLAETPICREGFRSPVYQLEMDYRALATRMEELGLRVDLDHCREADEQLQAEIHHSTEMIRDRFDVDVMSTQQLVRWLMGSGAKISKRTAKGSPSVDRESLELIIAEHPEGDITLMARTALRIRTLTKLSSSYFRNFTELAQDGLLHPSIETIAARTGRTSIREPALQTLPRGDNPDAKLVRTAVIPRNPDELLVSCDYEQIELRLMAAESGDVGLVEAFAHADSGGADFFTSAMRQTFDDPSLPKSDPRRTLVKTLFYAACPTPDTMILCDDLVWRPAGELEVGQGLIAFDEHYNDHPHPRARARRWRKSEVTYTDITPRECVRITLESGRVLTCAWDHHWLAHHARHTNSVEWVRSADLRPGYDALPRYTDTWGQATDYDSGWLAGMFDGEGHLSKGRWNVSQLPGAVTDHLYEVLDDKGVGYKTNVHPQSGVVRLFGVGSRLRDDMKLLGSIQARRLVAKYPDQIDGMVMWRMPPDEGGADVVVSVEKIGKQPTVTLQTTTHTYLAEGYGAHNSYGAGVAKMAQTAGVPEDEMRDIHSRVFARYPGVKTLMRRLEGEVHANDGWVETPFGRRIHIDEDHAYKALNARIQGFAADLFKKAAVDMAQAGLADFMVVPVHDEMLFSIPADILEDVRPVIEDTMTMSWEGVGLPAAPSDGYENWGKVPK